MMDAAEEKHSNVIEISFNKENLGTEISPSAPIDDPLLDLLHEFDDLTEEIEEPISKDYIHHLEQKKDYRLKLQDSSVHMSDVLIEQTKRLKEDIKRLSYYLDEMYID